MVRDRLDGRGRGLALARRRAEPGAAVDVAVAAALLAANLAALIGGILVFGEPIGSGPLEIGARFIAFSLVIAGERHRLAGPILSR